MAYPHPGSRRMRRTVSVTNHSFSEPNYLFVPPMSADNALATASRSRHNNGAVEADELTTHVPVDRHVTAHRLACCCQPEGFCHSSGGYRCPECGAPFTPLGDHAAEQLDWLVIVQVRADVDGAGTGGPAPAGCRRR